MSNGFQVKICGIQDTRNEQQVIEELSTLFKRPAEEVKTRLTGGALVVKKGLDLADAQKYLARLHKAGCLCSIELAHDGSRNEMPVSKDISVARLIPVIDLKLGIVLFAPEDWKKQEGGDFRLVDPAGTVELSARRLDPSDQSLTQQVISRVQQILQKNTFLKQTGAPRPDPGINMGIVTGFCGIFPGQSHESRYQIRYVQNGNHVIELALMASTDEFSIQESFFRWLLQTQLDIFDPDTFKQALNDKAASNSEVEEKLVAWGLRRKPRTHLHAPPSDDSPAPFPPVHEPEQKRSGWVNEFKENEPHNTVVVERQNTANAPLDHYNDQPGSLSPLIQVENSEDLQWPARCVKCGSPHNLATATTRIGMKSDISLIALLFGFLWVRGKYARFHFPVCKKHWLASSFASLVTQKSLVPRLLRFFVYYFFLLNVGFVTSLFRNPTVPQHEHPFFWLVLLSIPAFAAIIWSRKWIPVHAKKTMGEDVLLFIRNARYAEDFVNMNKNNALQLSREQVRGRAKDELLTFLKRYWLAVGFFVVMLGILIFGKK